MKKFAMLGLCALLAACGGGGGNTASSSSAAPSSAVLNDAPVKGVCYKAEPSGLSGATDTNGIYQFQPGDNVSFWIDVSGAGCGTTPADSTSTTAISLGSMIPGTATGSAPVQTFILAMETGPQAAQVLQALNHGTASSMDVSSIALPTTQVTNLNTYLAAGGDTSQVAGTPTVQALFAATQASATVAGAPLAPLATLPVTASFETDVSSALATTVATGLGTGPTTVTIPANRISFGSSSGTQTTNGVTTPFNGASINWFDGNGVGKRFVSPSTNPSVGLNTITTANIANYVGSYTQPFTYTVNGNVVSKAMTINNFPGTTSVGTITDANTIQYSDDHGSFFAGTMRKTITSTGAITDYTYSGSTIRLTPLTPSMVAGKTITLAVAGCPTGTSINVYSSDGSTSTNTNCGGEIRTNVTSSIPGIVVSSSTAGINPDGSIILIGLDGDSVKVGATLVFLTLNQGTNPDGSHSFPAWGRAKILAVQ